MSIYEREQPLDPSIPDWHRAVVGGLWDEIGQIQFDFLVTHGLQPHHHLLDVGCGSLRGGIHFIGYLAPGHYVGIDANRTILEAGRTIELTRHDLWWKKPTLLHVRDFDVAHLGIAFDFAVAVSVLTHLPREAVSQCLQRTAQVLAPGGRFYATIFEAPPGYVGPLEHARTDGEPLVSYPDRDPFHYDLATLMQLADAAGLTLEYVGDWGHPRGQRMLCCTRSRR